MRIVDHYKGIREVSKQLDPTNIKILATMARLGPRNLLEVSRQCNIPFRTVYHRIDRIEERSGQVALLIPNVAKIGLLRAVVFVTAMAGQEEKVLRALKIPNLWRSVEPCEGPFTAHSIQLVPTQLLRGFREYLRAMIKIGLIKNYRVIPTRDSVQNFPDFSGYNPETNEWTFDWQEWLNRLRVSKLTRAISDRTELVVPVDLTDLRIIQSLELNARASFTDIAKRVGVSPQIVKYRYDTKLLPSGILGQFSFYVVPYPLELAACHEVMLRFTSAGAMNRFLSLVEKLFFIAAVCKVVHQNALFVRTYIPQPQASRMFEFFSQMAKADLVEDYSAVRLDMMRRETQTISPELFENGKGWVWDPNLFLAELRKLGLET